MILNCPSCSTSLRLPVEKKGKVICPVCQKSFLADTRNKHKAVSILFGLPILGSLIQALIEYYKLTQKITLEKKRFSNHISSSDRYAEAMRYFEVAIGIGFLYLVPFFIYYESSPSKFVFVVQQVFLIAFYSVFLSIALKFLGGENVTFRQTFTTMGYLTGFIFPLNYILLTPLLIEIGPNFLRGGVQNEWTRFVSNDDLFYYMIINMVASYSVISIWLYLFFQWASQLHNIKKRKLILVLLLAGIPTGPASYYLITPIFTRVEEIIGAWSIAL